MNERKVKGQRDHVSSYPPQGTHQQRLGSTDHGVQALSPPGKLALLACIATWQALRKE